MLIVLYATADSKQKVTEFISILRKKARFGVLQFVEKGVFDKLAEGEEAAKTNKPDPSAYKWYVRVRFVQ